MTDTLLLSTYINMGLLPSYPWPITRLISFGQDANGQPAYEAEWEPSMMTMGELLEDFDGIPLLLHAKELKQEERTELGAEVKYVVVWKPTWVTLEELSSCTLLVHDFWMQYRRR